MQRSSAAAMDRIARTDDLRESTMMLADRRTTPKPSGACYTFCLLLPLIVTATHNHPGTPEFADFVLSSFIEDFIKGNS
jgi:hypothetical protein